MPSGIGSFLAGGIFHARPPAKANEFRPISDAEVTTNFNWERKMGWIQSTDDVGLPAKLIVLLLPLPQAKRWSGAGDAEFGAERGEIACNADCAEQNGGSGFNRDVFAGGAESEGEFAYPFSNHRFAAGENAVRCRMLQDLHDSPGSRTILQCPRVAMRRTSCHRNCTGDCNRTCGRKRRGYP